MGQKNSCISGSEDIGGPKNSAMRMNVDEPGGEMAQASQLRTGVKPVPAPYRVTKTAATETSPDWRDGEKDKDCGYNLVDLKGDKIDHTDTTTLAGCEVRWILSALKHDTKSCILIQIYAPGLGIGLVQAAVSQTKYNILYKVQVS
jgi:hypothetical protein